MLDVSGVEAVEVEWYLHRLTSKTTPRGTEMKLHVTLTLDLTLTLKHIIIIYLMLFWSRYTYTRLNTFMWELVPAPS